MNANEIIIGTKLEFELINTADSKMSKTYKSQFKEITGNREVIIASSVHEFGPVRIPMGSEIRAVFTHEIHGLLSFKGFIIKKEKIGSVVLLHLEIDEEFTKIQRREYFRLNSYLEAEYCLSRESDLSCKKNHFNQKPIRALVKNISFQGALIEVAENIPQKSIIDLMIWLTEKTNIKMKCKIIRSVEIDAGEMKKYDVNLYAIDVTPRDNDVLTKFITRRVSC